MGINDPYPTAGQNSDTTVPLESFVPYGGGEGFAEEGEGPSGGVRTEPDGTTRESGQNETMGDATT